VASGKLENGRTQLVGHREGRVGPANANVELKRCNRPHAIDDAALSVFFHDPFSVLISGQDNDLVHEGEEQRPDQKSF
jgi:hypothetical protein